ncbi:MAG: hypothetical protein QXL15_03040, partial [Candidatus Korarchaeota archaeon]
QEEIISDAEKTSEMLKRAKDDTASAANILPTTIDRISSIAVETKETFSTLDKLYASIDETRERIKQTIKEKLAQQPEISKAEVDVALSGIIESKAKFNDAIKEEFAKLKDEVVKVATTVATPIVEPLVQQLAAFLNTELQKVIEIMSKVDPISELQKKMTDMERKIAENLNYQLDDVTSRFKDVVQMKELNEVLPKLAEESPQKMEEYFIRFSEMARGLREEITNSLVSRLQLGALRGFFQKQVETVLTESLAKMEEFYRGEIISAVKNVLTSADNQIKETAAKTGAQMGYIHTALVDTLVSAINTVFTGEQKILNEMKAAYEEDLKKIVENIMASLKESAATMKTELMEEIKKLSEGVIDSFRAQMESLITKIGDIFDASISDMKNKISETMNIISTRIAEINKSISGTLLSTIDAAFDDIKSNLQHSANMIVNEVSKLSTVALELKSASITRVKEVSNVLDSIVAVSSESVSRMRNTLERIKPQTEKNINEVSSALREIASTMATTREQIKKTSDDAIMSITNRIEEIGKSVSKISEATIATFENIKSTLKTKLISALMKHIEGSMEKLWRLNEVLKYVTSMTAKAEEELKQVWFIESREAMLAEISRMVSKVRARIHIVAPSLDGLDINAIASLPTRINVRLTIGRIEQVKDREKINKLAKKEGLTLKISGNEEIFGAERDGEEVALCAVAGSDVMGIASTLATHAAIFRSTLESIWLNAREKIIG